MYTAHRNPQEGMRDRRCAAPVIVDVPVAAVEATHQCVVASLTFRDPLGHFADLLLEAALVSGFLLQVCFPLDGSLALLLIIASLPFSRIQVAGPCICVGILSSCIHVLYLIRVSNTLIYISLSIHLSTGIHTSMCIYVSISNIYTSTRIYVSAYVLTRYISISKGK